MPQYIKGLHEGFAFLCVLASDNYFLYFSSIVFAEILNISISTMPLSVAWLGAFLRQMVNFI